MKTIFFLLGLIVIITLVLFFKHRSGKDQNIELDETLIPTVWDSVLIGKWQIYDLAVSKKEKWETNSKVEFFKDHRYRYNASEEYTKYPNFGSIYPDLTVGGGSTGIWHARNDSSFTLNGKECDFKISEKGSSFKDKVRKLDCKDGFVLRYGTIASLDFSSQIKVMSRDSIVITGQSFSDGCEIRTEFTRIYQ